jgi:hypothetical protein
MMRQTSDNLGEIWLVCPVGRRAEHGDPISGLYFLLALGTGYDVVGAS